MNPALRRIRWHLLWSSLLALLLSGGTFYLTQWTYAYSDDQCSWIVESVQVREQGKPIQRLRAVVREILPDGVAEEAGILEGDELKEIQGRKVRPERLLEAQRFINDQKEGRILLYKVLRRVLSDDDGPPRWVQKELLLPVRMVKPFNLSAALIFVSGLVAWTLGLVVVISAPHRKVARHFYALGLLALLALVPARGTQGNIPGPILAVLDATAIGVSCLFPPLWLHFCLRFPHTFNLKSRRKLLVAIYGVFALVGIVALVVRFAPPQLTPLLAAPQAMPVWAALSLRMVWPTLATIAVLGGTVFLWWGAFRISEHRRRALLPALLVTTTVMLDLALYTHFALWSAGQTLMFQRLRWVFFLPLPLLPLTFAYAILRHGILDVRKAILRWLSYFLAAGLAAGLYLAALAWAFAKGIGAIPPAWAGVLLGLSALPIGWFMRWILLRLRRVFRRDLQAARDLILGHLREGRRRLSEEALLKGLLDSLQEAYRPQTLLLLPVEGDRLRLPAASQANADEQQPEIPIPAHVLQLPPALLRHARENRELVLGLSADEADWIREAGPALRAHIDALEVQVMVLLPVHDGIHSALFLGGKYAELDFGREDRELLREVAMATGILLETALLHRKSLDQGRIEQELRTARTIQESLITTQVPALEGYQMALRLEPALETGGDLLWVKRRPSGRWIAAVGDVSGKGLAAALYMSQATALLKFATQSVELDFDRILPSLDRTLRNLMSSKDFLTLCLLEWDEGGTYRLIRAGHPPALLIRGPRPEDCQELEPSGLGLGLRPEHPGNWAIQEGQLGAGDWLVMYSDGLTEAMDQQGQIYGTQRLRAQLQRLWGTGSVRAACEAVFADVSAFEAQNRDDRTLLILGRNR